MGKPYKGQIKLSKEALDKLADEMVAWMQLPNNWMLKEFASVKMIPYEKYFLEEFPNKSMYFREMLQLCLDKQEVMYWKQVQEGNIPQTFGIFGAKNILGYRDKQTVKDNEKAKAPEAKSVKDIMVKAKEKWFTPPE